MAPELVQHQYYNNNADIWSLGVLLYEMLHGHPPFKGRTVRNTINKIIENHLEYLSAVKPDAREVIDVILNLDLGERPTVCQILDSD